jgi:hypothetical protein
MATFPNRDAPSIPLSSLQSTEANSMKLIIDSLQRELVFIVSWTFLQMRKRRISGLANSALEVMMP